MGRKKALDPEVIAREQQVLELRLLGLKWQTIAEQAGYATAGAAHNAYTRALLRVIREPADEVRQQELERLDRIMTKHLQEASKGHMASTYAVLKIMDQRAKLLGLYVQKVETTSTVNVYQGGGDIDAAVEELRKALAERAGDSAIPLE